MPIYEYRCSACGFEKDALQKLSDAPLRECPQCAKPALVKLVSAAGFQLKGSGWYATDFKGSGSKPKPETSDSSKPKDGESAPAATSDAKASDAKASDSTTTASETSTKPSTPPAPGG